MAKRQKRQNNQIYSAPSRHLHVKKESGYLVVTHNFSPAETLYHHFLAFLEKNRIIASGSRHIPPYIMGEKAALFSVSYADWRSPLNAREPINIFTARVAATAPDKESLDALLETYSREILQKGIHQKAEK